MRAIVLGVVAAAVMAGCDDKPVEALGYAERVEIVDKIIKKCEALGIPRNSPEMQQCGMAEIQAEETRRSSSRLARQNFGIAMQQASQNYQRSMQSRRMNCTHTPGYGGSVSTSCY
ncbi:hypothetical protein [Paracoccus sp. AS002]|uniref:hypothetical protein n=1 Tax=Paracoccus sp. AS002 TaxID=3019545 RepID=UPI0023E76B4E|nr:hypothetical protein [Paracoccus sp. AS002]MDF3904702.1 hypothetical protein [Paracoccus sp. AS002]